MKKYSKFLFVFAAMLLLTAVKTQAQIVVKIRPEFPDRVEVRTRQPAPRYEWVGHNWEARGNHYIYRRGHWAIPPRPGSHWVSGYWKDNADGHVWIHGYWS